jgi:RND superfamily putative drug exporter
MARWTLSVIRHRRPIIAIWLVLLVVGGAAASNLGGLLTNRFSVPGSESERGLDLLKQYMHERSDGAFTLVVVGRNGPPNRVAVLAAAQRAARAITGGRASTPQPASRNVVFVQITTPLENQDAAKKTPAVRRAIGAIPGATRYLTGFPAINHDTQPIYNRDLGRGELIAGPIALLVMLLMFGTLGGVVVPFVFAAVSIPTTLGLVWIFAHTMDMAIYVTNIVTLIGFAIAIDYSMLVVFRYREELALRGDPQEALLATMSTAGRATLFSGATVAIGLALLVFMPLPFMRSMGVGGLLVPLVSIAASATFLPAFLSVMGTRVNRLRVIPRRILERRAAQDVTGAWHRLAVAIMRRPIVWGGLAAALMIALALAATGLHLTAGDNRGVPLSARSARERWPRTRSSSTPTGPAAPTTRRSPRPSDGWWPSCGAIPRSCRRPSSPRLS